MFMVTLAAFPAVISGIKPENDGDGSEWTGINMTYIYTVHTCKHENLFT